MLLKMWNILKFFFNLFFEIKYRVLYFFTKNREQSIEIQNAYIIQKNTKEFFLMENMNFIKKIGHEIIINFNNTQNDSILDIGFKWNKKDYRIQFLLVPNINIIIFPFFSLNDIKMKVNNQIIMVEDDSCNIEMNTERNKLINQYCGPIGDFYKSKNFGIPLSNLYSLKYKDFLFRDVQLRLEDLFLNEYEINKDNQDYIFLFKRNLDETKINKYNTNEDYILKNYNKFNLDWKKTIVGILNWIFCKKKNE
jgi:hypothetical protein